MKNIVPQFTWEVRSPLRSLAIAAAALTLVGTASGQSFAPLYDLLHLPGTVAGATDRLLFGGAGSDAFGRTVRTGDINGDGVADLIVGATGADVGTPARLDAGAVYVWFGKASIGGPEDSAGIAGTAPDVTIWGASGGDQVTAAGSLVVRDLNGDGAADLLLGSAFADGPEEGRGNSGEAYIVFGKSNLPPILDLAIRGPGGADVTIFGASTGDNLTSTGAFAVGDFNGDGQPDLLLGAPMADGPVESRNSAGEAYLVYGRADYPALLDLAIAGNAGADVTLHAANASDFMTLGGALTAGDINSDGVTDVILAAQGGDGPAEARTSAGEVLVVFGRADLPATIDLATQGPGGADVTIWGGTANDLLSSSGALTMGDLDGDGDSDLILGASGGDGPAEARSGAGEAYVIRGRDSLPVTIDLGAAGADLTIYGATATDSLSSGGAFALGDMNGDGVQELVIGAPLADGPSESRSSAGEAYIIFGGAFGAAVRDVAVQGSAGADVTIYGATGGDNLCIGRTLMVADVNGNGIGDLVLGAPLADGPADERISGGEAYVIRGRAALPATLDLALPGNAGANVTLYGATANDQLTSGGALAAGDLNGDGLTDVILGASAADGPGETRFGGGEATVLFGIGTPQIAVAQPAANPIPSGGVKDFGNVGVDATRQLTFSIRNVGAVNLTIGGLTIDGVDAALFALESTPAAVVPPGGNTSLTLSFTADAIGLRQAMLSISSNDEDQSPFEITLSALGVVPIPPVVATLDAEVTGKVAATLNGTVDAAGSEREVFFEYGTTASYGTTVRAEPGDVDGSGAIVVHAALDGLLPRTLYHYRVRAFGPLGEASGEDRTFETPNQIPVSLPDVFAIQPGASGVLDVLANDTDADGDTLSVISFTRAKPKRGGKVELRSGQLIYSASHAFNGATFGYQVADGYGGTATASVTLIPLACSITPTAANVPAAGGTYPITVTANGFWVVDDHQWWISASPASGFGNATVNVTVQPHQSKHSRKASIKIGGEEHSLVQAGWRDPNALPETLIASFEGLIARDPTLNGNLGSRLEMTTTRSGSFTAKITTGKTPQPFVGAFKVSEDQLSWETAVELNRPHQASRTLSLLLDSEDLSLSGQLADGAGAHIADAMGWRSTTHPSDYAAGYAFSLNQPDLNPALPQGDGGGIMAIESSGCVYVAGTLSDNSTFTGSAFVGPEGQVLIYEPLSANDGSLAGALEVTAAPSVTDNSVGGELSWFGQPVPGTKKSPPRPGFGPIPLTAEGEVVVIPRRR